jgi:PAS domain S-box-containing protein
MSTTSPRYRPQPTLLLGYLLAFVLPVVGSLLTQHIPSLHATPFAAHFIAAVCIAAVGGFAPAMLSIAIAVVLRNFIHISWLDAIELPNYHLIQVAILSLGTLVIAMARSSRLGSQLRLEHTLAELQERNADLIASLGNSKCACWSYDLDAGSSPRWYPGSYPIFGRPFAEIEAMSSLRPLVHEDDYPRFPLLIEQFRTSHEPVVFEYRCPWPNGELHWLEMRANRVPGKACVWRGVTLDITDRKRAETALLHSEKLAAMGRLASTVAHEINNPLEAVTNLLYLARLDDTLHDTTRTYLSTAERELARLSNITRLTLGFVRIGGEVSAVDMAAVTGEVLSIFQHRLETLSIRLHCECAEGILVQIAPHELRQIVTNLVANAADAVATAATIDDPPCIAVRIFQQAESAILLVEDNGEGIASPDHARIFEAFYSTKTEVGTGIGLWVSNELAEKNGGRICVESTRERGTLSGGVSTRFRVELPLAAS